jgi:hypothetical protein
VILGKANLTEFANFIAIATQSNWCVRRPAPAAERQAISGTTDATDLLNGLNDRQQVEVKAAQVEHGQPPISTLDCRY